MVRELLEWVEAGGAGSLELAPVPGAELCKQNT
jgi:hypothetical protein